MTKWHGGKGSIQKPYDKDRFDKNFEEIFGKKKKDGDKRKKPNNKHKKTTIYWWFFYAF